LEETLTISVADSELGFMGLLVGLLGWTFFRGLSEALHSGCEQLLSWRKYTRRRRKGYVVIEYTVSTNHLGIEWKYVGGGGRYH
jgi:hypothetical protein